MKSFLFDFTAILNPHFQLLKMKTSNKIKIIIFNKIFYCFKISGIAIMRLNLTWMYDSKNWKWSFVQYKPSTWYNVCLICILIAMHILTYQKAMKGGFGGRFDKDSAIIGIFDSLVVLTAVLILGMHCVKQKRITNVLRKMSKTKRLIDYPVNFKINDAVLLSLGNILMFFYPNRLILSLKVLNVAYALTFRCCLFAIISLFIQYSLTIKLVQNFYECINKNLSKVSCKSSRFHRLKSIFYTPSHKKDLNELMYFYRLTSGLAKELSDFYSLPMLWSLLAIFSDMLMCLYHLVKQIYLSRSLLRSLNVHGTSHVVVLLSLVVVLTTCVTDTIDEVKFYLVGINLILSRNIIFIFIFSNRARRP